jgi:hypothetical protein
VRLVDPRRLRKTSRGREKLTSGAKARTHFQRLNGTSKLVPFPFVGQLEFFRKLLGDSPLP